MKPHRLSQLKEFFSQPLALLPETADILHAYATGDLADLREALEATRVAAQEAQQALTGGGVAVLPLSGVICQHRATAYWMGGTSTEQFAHDYRRALADPGISRVVINCHTPGGTVYGVHELSKLIYDWRGQKPTSLVCNSLCASAGYYIGSAFDEVVITPGGEMGSIGVFQLHVDYSEALKAEGINPTFIARPARKVLGNPYEPLSEEALAELQKGVDECYEMFVASVARNRDVKATAVKSGFGQGGVVGAKEAVALGMADRIATLDQVLAEAPKKSKGRRSANEIRLALAEAE